MKKECYVCGMSFVHEGDPIDGNDLCGHICAGKYISIVRLVEGSDVPTDVVDPASGQKEEI
jgi:hypothetical protein